MIDLLSKLKILSGDDFFEEEEGSTADYSLDECWTDCHPGLVACFLIGLVVAIVPTRSLVRFQMFWLLSNESDPGQFKADGNVGKSFLFLPDVRFSDSSDCSQCAQQGEVQTWQGEVGNR